MNNLDEVLIMYNGISRQVILILCNATDLFISLVEGVIRHDYYILWHPEPRLGAINAHVRTMPIVQRHFVCCLSEI